MGENFFWWQFYGLAYTIEQMPDGPEKQRAEYAFEMMNIACTELSDFAPEYGGINPSADGAWDAAQAMYYLALAEAEKE